MRRAAQGNQCPYAHGVYERNLHPSKYRTQLCMEGDRCARRVCFFAHSHAQLRMPVGAWSLEEAVRRAPCLTCGHRSVLAPLERCSQRLSAPVAWLRSRRARLSPGFSQRS